MGIRRAVARIRLGPKRSRVRVGLRPFLFFIAVATVMAIIAIALNTKLEEQWKRARAAPDSIAVQQPGIP